MRIVGDYSNEKPSCFTAKMNAKTIELLSSSVCNAKGCQSMRNCLKSITLTICLTSLDVVCGNNAKQIVIQDLLLNIPDTQHKSFDAI